MITKREYEKIYRAGRKEQLEQDLSMLKDVVERSEDYNDFRSKLADQIRRLDLNVAEDQ